MANAKRCDRCGEFFVNNNSTNRLTIGVDGGSDKYVYKIIERSVSYDICPKCMDGLKIWLEQNKKDDA